MVSGGSDSVALARLLPPLYPACACVILHINHQLRGEDADEDERFVVTLAQELGIPCETRRVDVAARAAETNDNIERAGRLIRYREANALLDALCARAGISGDAGRIATAHTRDDRVETFFMRAIVGAGPGALASIPFVNGRVIRPLLDCGREQLREWLRESAAEGARRGVARNAQGDGGTYNLSHFSVTDYTSPCHLPGEPPSSASTRELWREDATNEDTDRLRAFVRHELIPRARTKNPELLRTVARGLDVLAVEDALITRLAAELTNRFVTECDDIVSVDVALFDEDQALIRRVIKTACDRVLPADKRITFEHIDNIAARGRHIGFATDIPGDVTVRNVYGTLVIRRKTAAEKPRHDPRHAGRRQG
jgi:tRNA(Ile)-lysidine synthase